MPLLSQLVDNRSQTQRLRTSVRYCDAADGRHLSSGTLCSYASPQITALVADDQRHKRLRNGVLSTHYSFNAIQNASLLLRINRRFESIDNDRQETIVDVLNDISNKIRDSGHLLERVVAHVDTEGTVCRLLQQICDTMKTSLLQSVVKNTALMVASSERHVSHVFKLRDELKIFCDEYMKSFDKSAVDTSQLAATAVDIRDKISGVETNFISELREVKESVEKNTTELSSIKCELQMASSGVEKLEATVQMNGMDVRQELVDMKHEISKLREEVVALKDAIIEVLPLKLVEAFQAMNASTSGRSSHLASDVEVVDDEETIDYHLSDSSVNTEESKEYSGDSSSSSG
jgi:hypothetical protein